MVEQTLIVPEYLSALTQLANEQRGYFTHKQAVQAGVSPEIVDALEKVHVVDKSLYYNRVFRLRGGGPVDSYSYYTAWLLLDDELPVSQRQPPRCCVAWKATALEWWGIPASTYSSVTQFVHPTTETRITDTGGSEIAIQIGSLRQQDWVIRDGLPVTVPARTLADLAQFASPEDLGVFAYKMLTRGFSATELIDGLTERFARSREEFPFHFGWSGADALVYWLESAQMPTEVITPFQGSKQ